MMEPLRSYVLLKRSIQIENDSLTRNPYGQSPEEIRAQEQASEAALDHMRSLKKSPSAPVIASTKPYRLPGKGEAVKMTNMRSRPQLDGLQGEVVSSGADAEGFITVRFGEAAHGDAATTRLLKVKPHKLQPLEVEPIDPAFFSYSDRASVRTASTTPSLARSQISGWSSSYASRTSAASSGRRAASGSATPLSVSWHRQHWPENSNNLNHLATCAVGCRPIGGHERR
eukprot:TRINITY_DN28664_c0_g1_i1.p1 TRINITY_DN28664_c0_g1~~TRINITY_DN28664_c0_g1_i1.p1  ORF type:complete len:228 (-),score=21.43 TRINITY_DN28664_c0_g1_i1:249-932(-)